MSSSTSEELIERALKVGEDAVGGCKYMVGTVIPITSFNAFKLGEMNKKDRLEFKKKNTDLYKALMDNIKKGESLRDFSECKECHKENDLDAVFCQKCGTKLEDILPAFLDS